MWAPPKHQPHFSDLLPQRVSSWALPSMCLLLLWRLTLSMPPADHSLWSLLSPTPGGALLISALLRLESLTSHSLSPSCLRAFPGQHSRQCLLGIRGSLVQGTWLSPWQTAKSSLEPMCHPPSHPLWLLGKHHREQASGLSRASGAFGSHCPAPHPAHSSTAAVTAMFSVLWPLSSLVTSCSDCSHLLHAPGRGVPPGHFAQV